MKQRSKAMRNARAITRARSWSRLGRGVSAALAAGATVLFGFALRQGLDRPAYAGTTPAAPQSTVDQQEYASPLEILLSPDGTRLYVLCQQSEEVRVLNSASYEAIGTIAVGRVPPASAKQYDPRHGALAHGRSALCHQFLGRHAFGYRYARAGRCRHLERGRRAIRRGRGPRGQVHLCRQPHLRRHCRARCADGRGGKAFASWTRRKLSDAFARWQTNLRNTYLSQSLSAAVGARKSHAARVGDHDHRRRTGGGCRPHSSALHRRRLSPGLLR